MTTGDDDPVEPTVLRTTETDAAADPRLSAADVVVGTGVLVLGSAVHAARHVVNAVEPVAERVLSPPALPPRLTPGHWLYVLGRRGDAQRKAVQLQVGHALDSLVPFLLDELLRRLDLTTAVTRYVDLDQVVGAVDLDCAAKRIDVDAVVGRADLEAVLDRLDLTQVVLERVDLDRLVQAVLDRADVVGVAREVIEAIDLPEIIRDSTSSIASDTVQGARMQGIAADEAVARVRHRLWARHGRGASDGDAGDSPPPTVVTATPPPHGVSG
jgi:hypothetical protein